MNIQNFRIIPKSYTKIAPPHLQEIFKAGLYTVYKSNFNPLVYVVFNEDDQSYTVHEYQGTDLENDLKKMVEFLNITHT